MPAVYMAFGGCYSGAADRSCHRALYVAPGILVELKF
jgi:hypothetical protein